jgi:molybdate transport system permease protein
MFDLSQQELSAIQLSLTVSFWAVIVTLPLGLWVSFILTRKTFFGQSVLNAIVHVPLVLPPVVTGYILLLTFGKQAWLGQFLENTFGLVLAFRWTGAVLAAAVMSFPLMVRSMRLSLEAVDPALEQAALTLGARRWVVYVTITLPLMLPGIIAGCVLAFAKAMGEFGATITFVSNIPGQTQTVPSAIYALLQQPGAEAQAARLVWISLVLSLGALAVSEWMARRSSASRRGLHD